MRIFKNSILNKKVDAVEWAAAAGVRAIKTMAQTAVAGIATATVMSEVDWLTVLSMATLAGVLSILTSIAGLPELDKDGDTYE